jgi:hypothetical protein
MIDDKLIEAFDGVEGHGPHGEVFQGLLLFGGGLAMTDRKRS